MRIIVFSFAILLAQWFFLALPVLVVLIAAIAWHTMRTRRRMRSFRQDHFIEFLSI